MAKVFTLIGLLCLVGCASVNKLVPKTPAEAAVLAVDAYEKADKAAMLACMAYKQGVYAGVIKPSAKADSRCDSLVDVVEEVPAPEPEPEAPPVTPTNHFPSGDTVPA